MSDERSQSRPTITIDLDGVICAPHLGVNFGIHREFVTASGNPPSAIIWPRLISAPWDLIRFGLRRPLAGSGDALERLAGCYTLVLLTGRRTSPAWWLRRHGLIEYLTEIVINRSDQKSPYYKLAEVRARRPVAHIDDDPRTAQLLATEAGIPILLRDWPRNRDLSYHEGVRRVASLGEAVEILCGGRAGDSGS